MNSKEIVLITGSGTIASELEKKLVSMGNQVRFLTRTPKKENQFLWDIDSQTIDSRALKGVSHIIHLAGAGIADKKWTPQRKKEILESRTQSTLLLAKALKKEKVHLKTFVSASAIGYYGFEPNTNQLARTETSHLGMGYLAEVCEAWEQSINHIKEINPNCRIVITRIGIVLAKQGGALQKMIPPIKNFVGAPLGTGKQTIPWIHIEDVCGIILFLLNNKNCNSIYNTTANSNISNKEFTKMLAKALNRPLLLPNVPSFVLKAMLGEMSQLVLSGVPISSEKIKEEGYAFKFENLERALKDLIE